MTDPVPTGGVVVDADEAAARWVGCLRPEEVAERLRGVGVPWCVAAGWALDLFRGRQSRPHGDLEIAIPAAGFPEVRERFAEYAFDAVGSGRIWPEAGADVLAATRQTWVRDPASDRYLFDVFREPHEGGTWIFRRDVRLRLPYEAVVAWSADGIPYLVPELVLLFKAKDSRAKDHADFAGVLPLLGRTRRDLLGGWLALVHPGHPWLAELARR
ncbi:hypothetical protein [Streptomyces sp. NPDC021562]|uniref:nucleotidyltransferase domain-containing protein n=1 Tax=Streptomyces sp. NPDC021562 TaxID=3155121 RepID=UPI00104A6C36